MGCGSSKETDDVNPQDIKLDAAASDGTSAKPSGESSTKSGYDSDIRHDKEAASSHLAHTNLKRVSEIYEMADHGVLGRGACGVVSVVRRKDSGELYAMKSVSLDGMAGGSLDELRKEIEIQKALTHPNICRLFESFEEETELHIIMEICTGGALVARMKRHSHGYGERAAATLLEKMLSAVLYCHHNGVVHRDIKLDNFIYENEAEEAELKLIDFGFAAEVRPPPQYTLAPRGQPPSLVSSQAQSSGSCCTPQNPYMASVGTSRVLPPPRHFWPPLLPPPLLLLLKSHCKQLPHPKTISASPRPCSRITAAYTLIRGRISPTTPR